VKRALVLVSLLALARVAFADEASDDARLNARLSPDVARDVSAIVHEARAAGLPTDPLIARAFEGARRGADPAGIVAGVRRLRRPGGGATGAGPGSGPDGSSRRRGAAGGRAGRLGGAAAPGAAGGEPRHPLVVLCDRSRAACRPTRPRSQW
jgi:hypothetical protein